MSAAVWIALDDVDGGNGTMSVLPGHHTKGTLPRIVTPWASTFTQTVDPAVMPADVEAAAHEYRLKAGQMAMHDVMIPHSSVANTDANRWRRVIVIRYLAASCRLGREVYTSFRDGVEFPREYFLVAGQDTESYGFRRSPFEGQQQGYVGDASVVSLAQPDPEQGGPAEVGPGVTMRAAKL